MRFNGSVQPHLELSPCQTLYLSSGLCLQSLHELCCRCTYLLGAVGSALRLDILNVPCRLFLGQYLTSVSGWALDPCWRPISSPAYGSGSIYSWLDSLLFPWICCTSWPWTVDRHQDPSVLTMSRLFGAVPVGESTARARSPLLLGAPA